MPTQHAQRLKRDLQRDPGILILAYPYARSWKPIAHELVRAAWGDVRNGEDAALYLHFPFCHRKCKYCDFLAYYGRPDADLEKYVGLLREEIRITADHAGHTVIRAIAFGGGTPSLMPTAQVATILADLKQRFRFAPDAEVTMEVLPDHTVTREVLAGWHQAGINRLSFGVQSLGDALKRQMHRRETSDDALRILRDTPEVGFDNYNIDLICGLPEQAEDCWRETYRQVAGLQPPHVCVFPVSVRHQGIALYGQRDTLPPPERARQMYEEAHHYLAGLGYERTTRHNFRRVGQDFVYERMMACQRPLIGLGAHSISRAAQCVYKNHSHLGKYADAIANSELPIQNGHVFPVEEQPHDFAVRQLEHLRLDGREFAARFGASLTDTFRDEIRLLEEYGLGRVKAGDLELTDYGVYHTASVKRLFFHSSAWDRIEEMTPEQFKVERGLFATLNDLVGMPA